ncbi:Predicted dehydrogenase [Fulvimarina pelagi HTCC2506]|uniref:Predicted dehydrogenase n=1 Tax=Fulvimarina pelagi HTCC2506 TaxID=314231 RepID=Q0G1S0_9HYPH|nr:Gfo/Idh/MocA family oxidoreductase [Fulvimarina pelagi]EAU41011.1 Predicted dehydrogenase [Fulvimarina pelagi HTCC2506]
MYRIAILGLGAIGSRHLQALVRSSLGSLVIHIVEPLATNRELALQRWVEAGGEKSPHRLSTELVDNIDIAIVATTAQYRRIAIEALLLNASVKYWILEKPLAQSLEDIQGIVSACGNRAVVNTPRRAMEWHKHIARLIREDGGPKSVSVHGGDWSISCNAMHFIDLVRFWSNAEPIAADTSSLWSEWHTAKRPGFIDVFGRLVVEFQGGIELSMEAQPEVKPLLITVNTNSYQWRIYEGEGICKRDDGLILKGKLELQSSLTGKIVDQVISGQETELPALQPLARAESLILEALILHSIANGGDTHTLPIT